MKFDIELPLYESLVRFYGYRKPEKLDRIHNFITKVLGHEESEFMSIGASYAPYRESENGPMIYAAVFDLSQLTAGLLAHEVYHVANRVMDMRGIVFCDESEEAFAYLIGFLVDTIDEKLQKS